jgi:type II secretory pathway component PulJ
MTSRTRRRSGISLLEMVLTLAIAMLVLAAAYWSLSSQLGEIQAGREVLEEGTLARLILTRIGNDVAGHLAAANPRTLPGGSSSASSGSPATSGASGTTTGGATTDTSAAVTFNLGVQGDANRLVLFVSRVPRNAVTGKPSDADTIAAPSDLRRIAYWLVDGEQPRLARQELLVPTGQELDSLPPDVPNPESFVIAPEVSKIEFRYFDGDNWQASWDGSELDPVLELPIGPPSAIEITLTLHFHRTYVGQGTTDQEYTYRHVVAVPAGNNYPPPPQ